MDRAAELVQIVDAAMAEAVRKGGAWLACRPGCAQCCMGAFAISQADARRLSHGLTQLANRDPDRARRIRSRAQAFIDAHAADFPGDLISGTLDDAPEAEEQFASFADDDPCPALDPETQTCDLYDYRPITCRTFGPAVSWGGDAVGLCELCFVGATEEQIQNATVKIHAGVLEDAVEEEIAAATGNRGQTLVAFALRPEKPTV